MSSNWKLDYLARHLRWEDLSQIIDKKIDQTSVSFEDMFTKQKQLIEYYKAKTGYHPESYYEVVSKEMQGLVLMAAFDRSKIELLIDRIRDQQTEIGFRESEAYSQDKEKA